MCERRARWSLAAAIRALDTMCGVRADDSRFVSGEPVSYQVGKAGSPEMLREMEWVESVASAVGREWVHPHLRFSVSGWKRRGHRFDIDNLAKPVLARIAPHARSVWVEVAVESLPGVLVGEQEPAAPAHPDVEAYLPRLPKGSSRPSAVLPELEGRTVLGNPDQRVGLWLSFDSDLVRVGNLGLDGPVKSVIDNLWPLLGGAPHDPADHRIRELRIIRGANPADKGVAAALWLFS